MIVVYCLVAATFQAAAMFSQHEHCGKSHDIVALKSIAPKSEIGADAEEQENSNDSVEAQPESPDEPDNEEEEEDEQEDEPENELEHANNHENEVEHEDEQEQELNHGPANENEQEYDYSTVIAETPQLTVTTNTVSLAFLLLTRQQCFQLCRNTSIVQQLPFSFVNSLGRKHQCQPNRGIYGNKRNTRTKYG